MLKRFILWDFPRGSRPYDIMVAIILAFVLLTPRAWFRDQPKIPHASRMGSNVFVVDPELLSGIPEEQRPLKAAQILKNLPGERNLRIARVEPMYDSEGEIKGFMAFSEP
jgi:hypothetical protein